MQLQDMQLHAQVDRSPRSAAKILVYGIPPMVCTATEMSERGATLIVVSLLGIPDTFELVVAGEEKPRRCVVVRKAPYKVRVAFQ